MSFQTTSDTPRLYEHLRISIMKLRILASESSNAVRNPIITEPVTKWTFFEVVDGRITAHIPDLFLTAVQDALPDRIRFCEICGKVFYANRNDKRACLLRCGDALRQRRSYQLQKERGEQYRKPKNQSKEKQK